MKTTAIVAILFLMLCCTHSPVFMEKDKTEVVDAVRLTLNNYYSDVKKNGLTAEFRYLDSSKEFFWVPPGYTGAISYDSVVAVLKQNAANYRSINNTIDTLKINPLNRETAIYTGRIHSAMTDTSGKTAAFFLLETGVMIKRTDGWKLLSGHTSILNH